MDIYSQYKSENLILDLENSNDGKHPPEKNLNDRGVNSMGDIKTPANLIFNKFKMFCCAATRNVDGSESLNFIF
ncbi:hypothetical protein F8M41_015924 [Gigaspora margarita]|uniref:Uncharacterized protein n=1 Tax=Gigaspora margarita TaxID=4874 RepID=A0A8H4EMW3_GIGMA|nr:hypothetical protein F8M41_015924 [Gigaspora margarita]